MRALSQDNVEILFRGDACFVVLDGKRYKIGTRQKINLYELKLIPELPSAPRPPAMAVSRAYRNHDLLQLWHYRLDHANFRLAGDLLGLDSCYNEIHSRVHERIRQIRHLNVIFDEGIVYKHIQT